MRLLGSSHPSVFSAQTCWWSLQETVQVNSQVQFAGNHTTTETQGTPIPRGSTKSQEVAHVLTASYRSTFTRYMQSQFLLIKLKGMQSSGPHLPTPLHKEDVCHPPCVKDLPISVWMTAAEYHWISVAQKQSFSELLKADLPLPNKNFLLPVQPYTDGQFSFLQVGRRMNRSKMSYSKMHLIILHGSHPMTRLIVETEHLCLPHPCPTLLMFLSESFQHDRSLKNGEIGH